MRRWPAPTTAVEHHKDSAEALYALARVQMARRETDAAIATLNDVLRVESARDGRQGRPGPSPPGGRPGRHVGGSGRGGRRARPAKPRRAADGRARVCSRGRSWVAPNRSSRLSSSAIPTSPSVHALSGVLAGLKGNESAAKAHFERALQLDPKSLEAVRGLVALDLAARRPREARARVESRGSPKTRGIRRGLLLAAQTFAATGDLSSCRRLPAPAAHHRRRSYLEAYSGAGTDLREAGPPRCRAGGVRPAGQASASGRSPRSTFAGTILQGQGKTDQARDRFTRALELDPDAAVAANNLAWLYAESGDRLDAALELAQRAKARLPKSHEVDDTLGFVHYKRNAPADAIPYFERSVAAAPDNPVYHYHLGLARAKTGDTAGARVAFDRAVALKPGYSEAVSARQTLSSAGTSQ